MLYLLWGEVDVKGKKAELTERFVWSCLFLHTYNTPSAKNAQSSRFWGWWRRTLVVQFYILSKGLPTMVLQTRLQIAFMEVGVLERTEGETETTTCWTTSFTTLDHLNSQVHYTALLAILSSRRPSSCGHCKICPSRGFTSFQKIKGFENKIGMSTEDVNTGAKWTGRLTNWQSKSNNKAECNQSHLDHEQKFVDTCKVGEANVLSKKKKKGIWATDKPLSEAEKQPYTCTHELHPPLADG